MRVFLFNQMPLERLDREKKEECVKRYLLSLGFKEDGELNKKGLFPRRNYLSSLLEITLITLSYGLNPLRVAKGFLKLKRRWAYGYKEALEKYDFTPLKKQLETLSAKGPQLAIFTNDSKEALDIFISVLGKDYFSYSVNDSSLYKKPRTRCIREYSRFTSIATEDMILISDSVRDLRMGRKGEVGIVVAIEGTEERRKLEKWADFVFPDIVSALSFFIS